MNDAMIDKARANRNAALNYVDMQKAKLVLLTGFCLDGPRRSPFPSFGFSSSRARYQEVQAA